MPLCFAIYIWKERHSDGDNYADGACDDGNSYKKVIIIMVVVDVMVKMGDDGDHERNFKVPYYLLFPTSLCSVSVTSHG